MKRTTRTKSTTTETKQQNTTIDVVENVQAKRKAGKTKPGQFFQNPKGEWIKK